MTNEKHPIRFYSERDGMKQVTARQLVKRSGFRSIDPVTGWNMLTEKEWQAVLKARRPAGRPVYKRCCHACFAINMKDAKACFKCGAKIEVIK